jgi:hypothetical protein
LLDKHERAGELLTSQIGTAPKRLTPFFNFPIGENAQSNRYRLNTLVSAKVYFIIGGALIMNEVQHYSPESDMRPFGFGRPGFGYGFGRPGFGFYGGPFIGGLVGGLVGSALFNPYGYGGYPYYPYPPYPYYY